MKRHIIGLAAGALLFASACAGAPKPTDQLVQTQAALRAAEEIGASGVPKAQLHETLAREQLDKATNLIAEDENERARHVLLRAKADAELAVALAREDQAQKDAESAESALGPVSSDSTIARGQTP